MVSVLNKEKLIIDLITNSIIFFRIDVPHIRNKYNRYTGKMKGSQITNRVRISQEKYERDIRKHKILMSLYNS